MFNFWVLMVSGCRHPLKLCTMEDIKRINDNLQIVRASFADSVSQIVEHNGRELCGVVTAFYTPDPVPFWFICSPSGFRNAATKQEVINLYNSYLNK